MTGKPLYLLHTRPDPRLLAAWVTRHHTRSEFQTSDLGDALHGLLRAAFGTSAPQPFRYLDGDRGLLAYTTLTPEEIARQVALADPIAAETLGLGEGRSGSDYRLRLFPTNWAVGQNLTFEVRVRPVTRNEQGEQDAFLRAVSRSNGAPLQREEIYIQWLKNSLRGGAESAVANWHAAVEILDAKMVAWRRLRIVRRTLMPESPGRRERRTIDGPDVTLKGTLRVIDSEAFRHLLIRGVGRHRSFGFGMLLLHRAD
jgi:CRISPR system Cascade subunit CasE